MHIRQANLKDVNQISELISNLSLKYIAPDCTSEGLNLLIRSMKPEMITQYMSTNCLYHVVEDNNQIAGVIAIRDNSHLFHMFVADKFQGKGLAKMLWHHAKDLCLLNGNTGTFTVNSALNAKSVYLKLGFKPISGVRTHKGILDIPMQITYTDNN
jgi:N-acetylglutamate synthase-like GNAT family acetyltransferase